MWVTGSFCLFGSYFLKTNTLLSEKTPSHFCLFFFFLGGGGRGGGLCVGVSLQCHVKIKTGSEIA